MQAVYNEETGTDSVLVYNETVYKIDENNGVFPGIFTELRFEANRSLTNAELDHLHSLIRYHWDATVGGLPLDDMFCDGDNAYSVSTSFCSRESNPTPAQALRKGIKFISTLNDFIASGSPAYKDGSQEVKPMADTAITVWASEVFKENA